MSAPLTPIDFTELTGVSRETLARLEAYADLLQRWCARINLVSRNTLDDLWRRHFLDSAQLQAFIPETATDLIDLGSGAGFPGLVLAILGVRGVELVDSDARKCAFLHEAARITATSVTIHNRRIEALPPRPIDVVTARACAPLDKLLALAQRFIGPQTRCVFLKGAQAHEELSTAQSAWGMTATSHPSRADPRGVVLCVDQVAREPRND